MKTTVYYLRNRAKIMDPNPSGGCHSCPENPVRLLIWTWSPTYEPSTVHYYYYYYYRCCVVIENHSL